ncbi:MAG: sigma-70 family RNA polymerase sigma factor [Planctomycetota bacterium]
MQTYLREINRIPLLSAQEEKELAHRVREGDHGAREQMIQANLRLVVNIAKGYARRGMPLGDLIEEGNVGLLRAVQGFDPGQGFRFSTYASWWIKQAIRRALVSKVKTIRIPAYMSEMIGRWRAATTELTDRLGRAPMEREVAEAMEVTPAKLRLIVMAANSFASADQPLAHDQSLTIADVLADESIKAPEQEVADSLEVEGLKGLLERLSKREGDVLVMRYGLFGCEPMTLKQIGERVSLTRERVRQIENQALRRLYAMMTDEGEPKEEKKPKRKAKGKKRREA